MCAHADQILPLLLCWRHGCIFSIFINFFICLLRASWCKRQLRIWHVWWQHKHGMVMECRFWHYKRFNFREKHEKGGKIRTWMSRDWHGLVRRNRDNSIIRKIGGTWFRWKKKWKITINMFSSKKPFPKRKNKINPLDKKIGRASCRERVYVLV